MWSYLESNESKETSETVEELEEDYEEYIDYDYFEKERAENYYERDFTLRSAINSHKWHSKL